MEGLNELSPAILAYMGDAVYEMAIRRYLVVELGIRKPRRLHLEAVKLVKADAQARMAHLLENDLEPDEAELLRRGRNTKTGHVPANVPPITYRYSTAWESLIGYLYLQGKVERMDCLIRLGIERLIEGKGELSHV